MACIDGPFTGANLKYGVHPRLRTVTCGVRGDIDQSVAKVKRPRKGLQKGGEDRGGGGSEHRLLVWNRQPVEEHANNS